MHIEQARIARERGGAASQLRIIFAGRELGDGVKVETCDLGNQSVLHAVRVERAASPVQLAAVGKSLPQPR